MSHNKVLLQSLVLAVAGGLLETKFLPEKFNDPFKFLSETSPILPLPRGYALIIILHSITLMWLLVHGLSIGAARSKYKELAKKDGEKNVEDRYLIPFPIYTSMETPSIRKPSIVFSALTSRSLKPCTCIFSVVWFQVFRFH